MANIKTLNDICTVRKNCKNQLAWLDEIFQKNSGVHALLTTKGMKTFGRAESGTSRWKLKRYKLNWLHVTRMNSNRMTKIMLTCRPNVRRDSSVGIATGYGLDGPGIKSRCGREFPHLSRPTLGPTQPPVELVPGIYRG